MKIEECAEAQDFLNIIFKELLGENGSDFDWCNNITYNTFMTNKLLNKYSKKKLNKGLFGKLFK